MPETKENKGNIKYSFEGTENIEENVRKEMRQKALYEMGINMTVEEYDASIARENLEKRISILKSKTTRKSFGSLFLTALAYSLTPIIIILLQNMSSSNEFVHGIIVPILYNAEVVLFFSVLSFFHDKAKALHELDASIKEKADLAENIMKMFGSQKEKFEMHCKEQMAVQQKRKDRLDELEAQARSNLSAIPYFAGIIADFETKNLDIMIAQLDHGHSQARMKKVKSLIEIKRETKLQLQKSKEAEYQLAYAMQMFPALEDFIATDYAEAVGSDISHLSSEHHDATRNYLSAEEYAQLSTVERNQLALDRYMESHRKSNWQIGRDYENYVGYLYTTKGYSVEYFGSLKGVEDLGRDLIARKDETHLIVQCKFWSKQKQIHEKHINQLYGTMVEYAFENNIEPGNVCGVFVTNITLSETARKFSNYLGIEVIENLDLGEYPCIKCNINRSTGEMIYHLPFDQQYDATKIQSPGEFFAMTVAEAEEKGFRRAFRWYGQS